ncbi:uncharacterized protein MELLADRAFT_96288 [Melampsora larici-populina 98AG31]|uniref:Uncharacterized protein n=1 Tax=Melampsora larici-populina (strain 98AG31 / pathotype 3-4-7) TaxID=747676 RepID=F4RE84_MELLP|nr:uncharacterized protein MELLADRAFT_96288 [Melampsora larici-populina 98AG31]EGG09318.1 hypothetical protein MELLADRAFT_96288 [Melampsora larici-populina 98AG31]
MASGPNFHGVCDQCTPSQQSCIFSTAPSNPNGHWRCNSCRFFGFHCDYPETILEPTSPPAIPTTPTPDQQLPLVPSSPYDQDWSHLIGLVPEYQSPASPPPPSIAAQSVETIYPTDDPIFTNIFDYNLDWKNDHATELAWTVWRHFDNAMRIIKDTGYEIPNLANNSYNLSRDIVIDDYVARNTSTGNTPPTLSSFIPFPHHAERANAEYVPPINSPQSDISEPSDPSSSNPSVGPPNTDLPNFLDPSLK